MAKIARRCHQPGLLTDQRRAICSTYPGLLLCRQTPTLALIVNRFIEIRDFKSEKYWECKTKYRDVDFSSEKGKITSEDNANKLLAYIKDAPFEIVSFDQKEGKKTQSPFFAALPEPR